jgi:hypothetical protein
MRDDTRGGPPPEWVSIIIDEVCARYRVRRPRVQWWRREERWSSGHWDRHAYKLHVTAGTDELDQRLVLLHELAHLLRDHRAKKPAHHDVRFWRIAWDLYEHYGIADHAAEREVHSAKAMAERRRRERLVG